LIQRLGMSASESRNFVGSGISGSYGPRGCRG
jgi:hypothetical protein